MHHTGEHEQAHTHTQLLNSHTINMHHTGEHEQAPTKHVTNIRHHTGEHEQVPTKHEHN